jgi:hypothetical protein
MTGPSVTATDPGPAGAVRPDRVAGPVELLEAVP